MKLTTATFLPLALLAYAASAQPSAPSTQSQAQPPTAHALAVRVAPASASSDEKKAATEAATESDLESCGAKWNKKLADYKKALEQNKNYRDYFEKWKNASAQRPPMLPIPELTRASYRLCMAQCLGDTTAICPGGWPEDK
jgi:hypothetical protein